MISPLFLPDTSLNKLRSMETENVELGTLRRTAEDKDAQSEEQLEFLRKEMTRFRKVICKPHCNLDNLPPPPFLSTNIYFPASLVCTSESHLATLSIGSE